MRITNGYTGKGEPQPIPCDLCGKMTGQRYLTSIDDGHIVANICRLCNTGNVAKLIKVMRANLAVYL